MLRSGATVTFGYVVKLAIFATVIFMHMYGLDYC